jgi:hypothetical protein
MATCIVSRAMQLDGAPALSGILLAAGIAAYLVLAAVYAGRLAINRAASAPTRPSLAAAAVLLVIGGVGWAGLGYLLPPLLAGHGWAEPAARGSCGRSPPSRSQSASPRCRRPGRGADPATAAQPADDRDACGGGGLVGDALGVRHLAGAPPAHHGRLAARFGVGGHFDVWLGDDVGQGVITRRLFV